jgi:hypothetical protein
LRIRKYVIRVVSLLDLQESGVVRTPVPSWPFGLRDERAREYESDMTGVIE